MHKEHDTTMGRRLRVQKEDAIYFITNRCFQAQYWLKPDFHGHFNKLILRCLSIAQKRYGVLIYGYVFMSNHFHILVRAPEMNLSHFMRDVQSLIARNVNLLRKRRGTLFPDRFTSALVLDKEAVFTMARYILLNPVRAKLVETPDQWPGLISIPKNGVRPPLVEKMPGFRSFAKQWRALDASISAELLKPQLQGPFLGVDKVLEIACHDAPANPKRSRRRLKDTVIASDPKDKERVAAQIAALERTHRSAYDGFEVGVLCALKDNHECPEELAPPPITAPLGALPFLLRRSGLTQSQLQVFCR